MKPRDKKKKIKEIDDILDQYWNQVITGRTKRRRDHYSDDFINGHDLAVHRLIESRYITVKMLKDMLSV